MKNNKLLVTLLLLSAAAAFAVVEKRFDLINSPLSQWFATPVYIGPMAANPVTNNQLNRITNALAYHVDWNFASSTDACTDQGFPNTLPGSRAGDPCMVGTDYRVLTDDGGVGAGSMVQCFATDGGFILRHCATGSAASDPNDAGFDVRVFSYR